VNLLNSADIGRRGKKRRKKKGKHPLGRGRLSLSRRKNKTLFARAGGETKGGSLAGKQRSWQPDLYAWGGFGLGVGGEGGVGVGGGGGGGVVVCGRGGGLKLSGVLSYHGETLKDHRCRSGRPSLSKY